MGDMKRGRPPLDPDDRSVPVTFNLPSKQFERVCVEAKRVALTVPDFIRLAIRREVEK